MSLIICPECKREISDKSEKCIHCGYPLKSVYDNVLYSMYITGFNENSNWFLTQGMLNGICNLSKHEIDDIRDTFYRKSQYERPILTGIKKENINYIKEQFKKSCCIIEFRQSDDEQENSICNDRIGGWVESEKNKPKCPTCSSTNIHKIGTGERAVSVFGLGLFSKKINKTWECNECGYTW